LVVDHLQHDDALGLAHDVGAHHVFLLLILLLQLLQDEVGKFDAGEVGDILQIDAGAEPGEDVVAQGGEVPGVGVLVVGAAQVFLLLDDALHHIHDAPLLVAAL
jgi:hypothetical protein